MEYVSQKYDIELTKKQSKFERDYPLIMERIKLSSVNRNTLWKDIALK